MRHKNGCIDLLSVIDLKDFFFSLKEKPFRGERRGTGGRWRVHECIQNMSKMTLLKEES